MRRVHVESGGLQHTASPNRKITPESPADAGPSGQGLSTISAPLLDEPIEGSSLLTDASGQATLRLQLAADRPTLLAAVRHFGCVFCREMIKDLRIASELADANGRRRYPKVVFLHQATPRQGAVFFGRRWPGTAAISDPEHRLYDALHLKRGSAWDMFRPAVWWLGFKATLKGHFIGRPVGDPWRMPGLAMVDPAGPGKAANVRWSFRFEHAGSRPDYGTLVDAAGSTLVTSDAACQTDACAVQA